MYLEVTLIPNRKECLLIFVGIIGQWQSQNVTVPDTDTSNRTLEDDARGTFKLDDGGSFTFNVKSSPTSDESISYIEVIYTVFITFMKLK